MKIKIILILAFAMILTSCKPGVLQGTESSIYEKNDVQKMRVTTDQAQIRSGCSNSAEVVKTANQGDTYKVVSEVSDWYAVALPDNTIGFVPQNECQAIVDESQTTNLPSTTQQTPSQTTTDNTNTTNNTQVPNNTNITNNTQTNTTDTATNTNNTTANKAQSDATANNASLTADEQQMVDLVNKARSDNNLTPLTVDMEVVKVARLKAQDMIDKNYFSHTSPTYGSPFDMLKSFGVNYVSAGENIAGNSSVQAAHDALMNSPGHRANILNSEFTHIGIGIIDGGPYGKMFSQMFISKPQ